jgi:hypothetical protein
MILKGRFQMVEDTIMNMTVEVRTVQEMSFKLHFQKWKAKGSDALLMQKCSE